MFYFRVIFIFISFYLIHNTTIAQRDSLGMDYSSLNNRKEKTIAAKGDTLYLDSLTIVPQSLSVVRKKNGSVLSDSMYQLIDNQLVLKQKIQDSLFVKYRTLPYALHAPLIRKDRRLADNPPQQLADRIIGGGSGYMYQVGGRDALESLDFEGITYSGTFARGVSMGNNQDLVLNSSFNLQISGKLGDVEILGAITDNQVPLQPQGNTQQIQDFDRLFIQFKLQKHSLIAGDYDLTKPTFGYFSNYYRRLQGAQLNTVFDLNKSTELSVGGSFAISRGKFARYSFTGEEGNQGPYRLRGNNGERFIIVIAGTERVFIDGVLLTRGADQDYVIDYNQGEVRFTNKQLITKDKRIVIEFSYSDLNYLRTIYTANTSVSNPKYEAYFQFYSEQDSKNQPAREILSENQKTVLLGVGDDVENAYASGIEPVNEETGDPIRYRLIDTLANGILYDSIVQYSPDAGNYTVRFSQIIGGGNYIRTLQATNGAVYEWIAPDSITGAPRGTHEPVVKLVTPRQQQLMEGGAAYKINSNASIKSSFALSNNDLNTFSKVGNSDNWGWAARLSYEHKVVLGREDSTRKDKNRHSLDWKGHYEFLNRHFAFVEPYRSREFQRDWNVNSTDKSNEHLFWANLSLRGSRWGYITYEWSGLNRDSMYFGWKQSLLFLVKTGGLSLSGGGSWLQSKTATESTRFIRPKIDLSYTIKPLKDWKWGFYFEAEQNRRNVSNADSLSPSSLFFHVWRIYTELPTDGIVRCSLSAQRRYDYVPSANQFLVAAVADEVMFSGSWTPKPKEDKPNRKGVFESSLDWNFHYRNLRVPDSSRTNIEPKETYLGRLEYRFNLLRNFLRWTTTYELGAGQQQKIEYNYFEVDKGQGTYQWFDRNEDGVQQQNEFEIAVFPDQANFIRVVVFTGEFIRSNNVLLTQNLDIDGQALRSRKKTEDKPYPKPFFSRFATRSTFQIERKTVANKGVQGFNPFQLDVADTSLVSIGSVIRNSLFFNRSNPKFSWEFNQSDDRNKTLLSGGFESRRRSEYGLLLRWSVGKMWSGQINSSLGDRYQNSELFAERSYNIRFYKTGPQFTLLTKNKLFRTMLKYTFKHNQNRIGSLERAISHDVTTELKFTPKQTNLSFSFSWVQLQYTGAVNTPVEYTMTEGLKNGQNFLWSLSFSRYLSKDNKIQLFLSYEGRKTGEARTIHTGRMQIRASF